MIDGKIGKDVVINRPLDNWAPDAEGSTARVFEANINGVSHALRNHECCMDTIFFAKVFGRNNYNDSYWGN